MNRYAYANENPIMNDDPSGHSAIGVNTSSRSNEIGDYLNIGGLGLGGAGATFALLMGIVSFNPLELVGGGFGLASTILSGVGSLDKSLSSGAREYIGAASLVIGAASAATDIYANTSAASADMLLQNITNDDKVSMLINNSSVGEVKLDNTNQMIRIINSQSGSSISEISVDTTIKDLEKTMSNIDYALNNVDGSKWLIEDYDSTNKLLSNAQLSFNNHDINLYKNGYSLTDDKSEGHLMFSDLKGNIFDTDDSVNTTKRSDWNSRVTNFTNKFNSVFTAKPNPLYASKALYVKIFMPS